MINTIKNIIFITFLLGTGFIVLAVGWGGAPFNTAGSAVGGGATALGDAAQAVHDMVSNTAKSAREVSDAMHRAGEALWKPIDKLGKLLGVSEDAPAEKAAETQHAANDSLSDTEAAAPATKAVAASTPSVASQKND